MRRSMTYIPAFPAYLHDCDAELDADRPSAKESMGSNPSRLRLLSSAWPTLPGAGSVLVDAYGVDGQHEGIENNVFDPPMPASSASSQASSEAPLLTRKWWSMGACPTELDDLDPASAHDAIPGSAAPVLGETRPLLESAFITSQNVVIVIPPFDASVDEKPSPVLPFPDARLNAARPSSESAQSSRSYSSSSTAWPVLQAPIPIRPLPSGLLQQPAWNPSPYPSCPPWLVSTHEEHGRPPSKQWSYVGLRLHYQEAVGKPYPSGNDALTMTQGPIRKVRGGRAAHDHRLSYDERSFTQGRRAVGSEHGCFSPPPDIHLPPSLTRKRLREETCPDTQAEDDETPGLHKRRRWSIAC
ncbi:hypothetical protein B0H15DRAFT_286936 [Mycena belliarum]|uniref:Uncharacterized protein n=1 Tax=Mycena belliarum TaxID=1033014 RepID=A0AAD6U5U1_9AGAR|nr:hypothetical protein B0H15DRAFT_286936 [Mycena belliae]